MQNLFFIKRSYLFLFFIFSAFAHSATYEICFVPGLITKYIPYVFETLPQELAQQGIHFTVFDIAGEGDVQAHARRFRDVLQTKLQQNPNYRCHAIGYSMGGIIVRYAVSHLGLHHPHLGDVPVSRFIESVGMVGTPHWGTPLADMKLADRFATREKVSLTALRQMGESEARMWNEPAFSETYSPLVKGIPYFSYRMHIEHRNQTQDLPERLAYLFIARHLRSQGRDPRNDTVSPFDSQVFAHEQVIDLVRPHTSLARHAPRFSPTPVDFYIDHVTRANEACLIEISRMVEGP